MTPFELDILLHYYCCADDHRVVADNPPIWSETRKWMLEEKLLVHSDAAIGSTYLIGERGKVFIAHILALPLPEKKWVMP